MKTMMDKNVDIEYFATVINDLRIPTVAQISALKSFLKTSAKKIDIEEKNLIELTLNSCNYMENLIDTFALAYKLNAEEIILNYDKFYIEELISECMNELNILLKYYDLNIKIHSSKNTNIVADRIHLKRVIKLFLSNTIKTAFKGSEILITIEEKRGELIFKIRSNSPYILPEILDELFKKHKSHISYYSKPSIGLGMYLSKEIIYAHFGKMITQSYPNNINVFGFILPTRN